MNTLKKLFLPYLILLCFISCSVRKEKQIIHLDNINAYTQIYVSGQKNSEEVRKLILESNSDVKSMVMDSVFFEGEIRRVDCYKNKCSVTLPLNKKINNDSLLVYYRVKYEKLIGIINTVTVKDKIYMP